MKLYEVAATGVSLDIADCWADVSLGQWLAIAAYPEAPRRYYLDVLVSDVSQLQQIDAGALPELYQVIDFIRTPPAIAVLKSVRKIAGVMPPPKINLCPAIQYWRVEDWVQELSQGKELTEETWYVPLLAVYLYEPLTGERFATMEQAEAIRPRIEALPCLEALPLARFFLRSYRQLKPSGRVSSRSKSPSAAPSRWPSKVFRSWRSFLKMPAWSRWRIGAE